MTLKELEQKVKEKIEDLKKQQENLKVNFNIIEGMRMEAEEILKLICKKE